MPLLFLPLIKRRLITGKQTKKRKVVGAELAQEQDTKERKQRLVVLWQHLR